MIKKEIKNNLGLITVNQSQLNWCLDFGPGPHERFGTIYRLDPRLHHRLSVKQVAACDSSSLANYGVISFDFPHGTLLHYELSSSSYIYIYI